MPTYTDLMLYLQHERYCDGGTFYTTDMIGLPCGPMHVRVIGQHHFHFTGPVEDHARWMAWLDRCEGAWNVRRILRGW